MAIASAVKSGSAKPASKTYRAGKTPTHTLSVCHNPQEEDKSARRYDTLAFLFPTAFGTDANALGGAELGVKENDGDPIQKNPLVKYFKTVDRDGKLVIKKRVKDPIYLDDGVTLDMGALETAKGRFETVAELKALDSKVVAFVGEAGGKSFFVNHWSPKK